jgi:dTDP-4-dehydrorhamnose 3,5-epimerase-like enzyme
MIHYLCVNEDDQSVALFPTDDYDQWHDHTICEMTPTVKAAWNQFITAALFSVVEYPPGLV